MSQAVSEMKPGDTIAIYSLLDAVDTPSLSGRGRSINCRSNCTYSVPGAGRLFRIVQDYTSDPQQVLRSLKADWPPLGTFPLDPDPYFWPRAVASHLLRFRVANGSCGWGSFPGRPSQPSNRPLRKRPISSTAPT